MSERRATRDDETPNAPEPIVLAPESLERLADLVAERVIAAQRSTPAPQLIDAAEVARRFSLSPGFVYDHADDLGAVRLGDGPRPRLRFDPAIVAERLTACSASKGSESRGAAGRAKPRRPQIASGQNTAGLLPITPSRGAR